MQIGGNQEVRAALWVGALATLIRCFYYIEHARSAFFGFVVLDEKFYDLTARQLSTVGFEGSYSGFRSLFYPLALSWIYDFAGTWDRIAAIGAQHLLGVLTTVLVTLIGLRLFDSKTAGVAAGTLYLLSSPPLFFEGELLVTSSFTFLVALQLWLLCVAATSLTNKRVVWYALAGLSSGIATQFRPANIIFLLIYLTGVGLLVWRRQNIHARGVVVGVAGFTTVLLASALLMQKPVGKFQVLPSAGPINFYLGNKSGADGMIPRQDQAVSYGAEYRDSVELFAEQQFLENRRATTPEFERDAAQSAQSSTVTQAKYWIDRTVTDIAHSPRTWLHLMARKAWFLVWNQEIPNNKNFDFVRAEESPILKLLPVRWWLLLALAPLGCVAAWGGKNRSALLWVMGFLACYSAGLLLFFVNSRYRLPLWPAMAVLAGGGVALIASGIRRRAAASLLMSLSVAGAITLLSVVNWADIELPNYSRDFFFRSTAHLYKGDLKAAELDGISSCELAPSDGAARLQLGNVQLALSKHPQALATFVLATKLAPHEPATFNNLGITQERLGRHHDAYRSYLKAIKVSPNYSPALVNAALLEIRAGLFTEAEAKIRRINPQHHSEHLYVAQALIAQSRGELMQADRLIELARRINSPAVTRLLEDMQSPINFEDM